MQLAFFTTREVDALEELTWVSNVSFIRLYLIFNSQISNDST